MPGHRNREAILVQLSSTDKALAFNDNYAVLQDDAPLNSFDLHLAELGQQMEERFSFEDQLIKTIATVKSQIVHVVGIDAARVMPFSKCNSCKIN